MPAPKRSEEISSCLSVVMPVVNEAASMAEVARMVLAPRPLQELIVVDDCSQDNTWLLLQGTVSNLDRGTEAGIPSCLSTARAELAGSCQPPEMKGGRAHGERGPQAKGADLCSSPRIAIHHGVNQNPWLQGLAHLEGHLIKL